jgi:hypothetical protein
MQLPRPRIVGPSALHCERVENVVDLLQLRLRELNVHAAQVLERAFLLRRTRQRNDVWTKLGDPGDGELGGGDALLLGEGGERIHELKVVVEVL